jgi:hypothetical protein
MKLLHYGLSSRLQSNAAPQLLPQRSRIVKAIENLGKVNKTDLLPLND